MLEDVRIQLTGSMVLSGRAGHISGSDIGPRQVRTLIAFLTLNRARSVSSEELRLVLWEDSWPPAWEAGLRSLLSRVRAAFDAVLAPMSRRMLDGEPGRYRLTLPPGTTVDWEQAALSLEQAESLLRDGDTRAAHAPASVSTIVFRRPFLPGLGSSWAELQRERQMRLLCRSLECLAESWLAHDQPALAIEAASEAVARDPTSEAGCRLVMRANAKAGNPAEAVREYQRLREALSSELGLDPSPDTEALFLSLLR